MRKTGDLAQRIVKVEAALSEHETKGTAADGAVRDAVKAAVEAGEAVDKKRLAELRRAGAAAAEDAAIARAELDALAGALERAAGDELRADLARARAATVKLLARREELLRDLAKLFGEVLALHVAAYSESESGYVLDTAETFLQGLPAADELRRLMQTAISSRGKALGQPSISSELSELEAPFLAAGLFAAGKLQVEPDAVKMAAAAKSRAEKALATAREKTDAA